MPQSHLHLHPSFCQPFLLYFVINNSLNHHSGEGDLSLLLLQVVVEGQVELNHHWCVCFFVGLQLFAWVCHFLHLLHLHPVLLYLLPQLCQVLELVHTLGAVLLLGGRLIMHFRHEVGLLFLLFDSSSFVAERIALIIFFILRLKDFSNVLSQILGIPKMILNLLMERGESVDIPDDLDVFQHRRGDDVVEPNVLFEDGHAVVEIPTFYDLFIEQIQEPLSVGPR